MNKLTLAGIITIVIMLGATYLSVGLTKGGIGDDIVNMLAIAGAVALVIITVFVVIKYVRQMQTDTASGKLADENWDGIGEYKNELPAGWALMFLGAMIWAMWYMLSGYPVNAYSQIGEYNEDTAAHNAKFEAKYANMDDEMLVEMGESVFLAECKVCHGLTADGIEGKAADLNARISKESVMHVIMNGANNMKTDYPGGMPMGLNYSFADEAELNKLVDYVVAGLPEDDSEGAALFEKGTCNSCHGANGEGMAYAGPKIDGYDVATVSAVLKDGKKANIGTMPKFADRLNAKQIEAVSAYVTSLSK
jgi:cytochrome c oxidase cbb3-type subunit 3